MIDLSLILGTQITKNVDITRRVSGITSIRYSQNQNIWKQWNLKVFGSKQAKVTKQN
jgi:hypothetical protein